MILIVCLDDKGGMAFASRRQSKDRQLRARILELTSGKRLLMSEYSHKQFEEENEIIADNGFLERAAEGDYCFLELCGAADYEEKCEKIIVYRWNRIYPSDLKFDIDLGNWKLAESRSFEGSSHTEITEEVYER